MPRSVANRLLLVEGPSDKSFFEALCRYLGLAVDVSVVVPRDLSADDQIRNSKEGVLTRLRPQLQRLHSGELLALGVIVDADQPEHGQGFTRTCTKVSTLLVEHGYGPLTTLAAPRGGLLARHDDGAPSVGLWVMPDNARPGVLEDWMRVCRHSGEATLWEHAVQALDTLPGGPRFKPLTQRSKAEVATWLAWQCPPGEDRFAVVRSLGTDRPLLDVQSPAFIALTMWFRTVFASPASD